MLDFSRQDKTEEMRAMINTHIKKATDLTAQTAAGANQTSAASHELSRLAVDLKAMVARFVI